MNLYISCESELRFVADAVFRSAKNQDNNCHVDLWDDHAKALYEDMFVTLDKLYAIAQEKGWNIADLRPDFLYSPDSRAPSWYDKMQEEEEESKAGEEKEGAHAEESL